MKEFDEYGIAESAQTHGYVSHGHSHFHLFQTKLSNRMSFPINSNRTNTLSEHVQWTDLQRKDEEVE